MISVLRRLDKKEIQMSDTKQALISVIVPIYGVEQYLDKCINSILNQSYTNLEIILVDDGSPDKCGEICERYALKDKRIHVIHKENGGLSSARNAGMQVIKGEYVTFIDSDDYISPYYVEHLFSALNSTNSDLSISWFKEVSKDDTNVNTIATIQNLQQLSQADCFKKLLYQDGIETSAWGKLYKTKLIDGLRYPEGELYEDIPVTSAYIFKCNSVAVISNEDYFYLQRGTSIQYQNFNTKKMAGIYHIEAMSEQVIKKYPELKNATKCREFSCASNLLFQIPENSNKDSRDYLWQVIVRVRGAILLDKNARRKARIAAAISYLGYKTFAKVYHSTQNRG
jgi:glycosyltransferase involved in cell wall biosynthesis